MEKKTPEEVLRSVSLDFKRRGITHADAAEKMGFGSKQTVSNILAAKKYMSPTQALRFTEAFGYSQIYLMSGEGELLSVQARERLLLEETKSTLKGIAMEGQKRDALRVLYWVQEVFSKQNNIEGLAVCAEISRFLNVSEIARMELKDYTGDDYIMKYTAKVQEIRNKIADTINKMVEGVSK